MGNYGITALSGLSGSLDRQDQRNDMQDQRDWNNEYRGQQRKAWGRADEEHAAGAENRELARGNNKMQLLVQRGDLERKQLFQKLRPAFQIVDMDNGDKNEHGQAMAQILSGVNAKEIEFVPTEDETFQFKAKDGKTYGFKDFNDARMQIGRTFQDPVEFLKMRAQALNEEGLWITQDGKIVQRKRGDAEREGLTPYEITKAQGEMAALSRKNQGSYKTVETDKGIIAYNDQNPNKRVAIGGSPVDASKVSDAAGKLTTQFKKDLAFVLTPFVKPGTNLFNGDNLSEPAKNALATAQAYYDKNRGKEASLQGQDYANFKAAKEAIGMYAWMKKQVVDRYDTGGGSGSVNTGRTIDLSRYFNNTK